LKVVSFTKRKDGLFDDSLDSEEESILIAYATLVPTMKVATKVEHFNELSLNSFPSIYYLHSSTMQFPSSNILQAYEWFHSKLDC
jgi:hypothetical protein